MVAGMAMGLTFQLVLNYKDMNMDIYIYPHI